MHTLYTFFSTIVEIDVDVSSETEDEEFFDCDEGGGEEQRKGQKSDLPVWGRKPEGREKRLGKLTLLEHDDYLYIPICQVSNLAGEASVRIM